MPMLVRTLEQILRGERRVFRSLEKQKLDAPDFKPKEIRDWFGLPSSVPVREEEL